MQQKTNYIEQLRKYDGFSDYTDNEKVREIDDLLYDSDAREVDNSFQDGGRWSNYETTVFKVQEHGEVAYFKEVREVPATEMQEGGYFTYFFTEVVPKEVTVVKYVDK